MTKSKLEDFHIEYDKPGAIYCPGEIVSGKIVLYVSDSKKVREVRFQACGQAQVFWKKYRSEKDSSGRSHVVADHYKGAEEYFKISNRLAGDASGEITLTAGQHSYKFSFQLPQQTPSSFEHNYGNVRYYVEAVLDRPWSSNHKVESAFQVHTPYDLNSQENLKVGIDDESTRKFSWFCCLINFGEMKVNVKSKALGFVPGETLELIINYDVNSLEVDVKKLKIKLEKTIVFYASTPSPTSIKDTEIVKTFKLHGQFDKKGESKLAFEVPPLPPSRLQFCSLIDISYKLFVQVCVSGLHYNLCNYYPIEIGTVPIYRPENNLLPNSAISYAPSAPLMGEVGLNIHQIPQSPQPIGFVFMNASPDACSIPNAVSKIAPPSYEETISGRSNITNVNQEQIHASNVQLSASYPVGKLSMPPPYN